MTKIIRNKMRLQMRGMRIVLPCFAVALALTATNALPQESHHVLHGEAPYSAKLVEIVRDATRQFENVNATTGAGYQPAFGC